MQHRCFVLHSRISYRYKIKNIRSEVLHKELLRNDTEREFIKFNRTDDTHKKNKRADGGGGHSGKVYSGK